MAAAVDGALRGLEVGSVLCAMLSLLVSDPPLVLAYVAMAAYCRYARAA